MGIPYRTRESGSIPHDKQALDNATQGDWYRRKVAPLLAAHLGYEYVNERIPYYRGIPDSRTRIAKNHIRSVLALDSKLQPEDDSVVQYALIKKVNLFERLFEYT